MAESSINSNKWKSQDNFYRAFTPAQVLIYQSDMTGFFPPFEEV